MSSGAGPQAERDLHFAMNLGDDDGDGVFGGQEIEELLRGVQGQVGKGLDVTPAVGGREIPVGSSTQEYYEDEIARLRAENTHVKEYAQRLQFELSSVLQRTQVPDDPARDEDDEEAEKGDPLSPWVSSPHIFSPLLMAYDTRMQELRSVASSAKRQLEEAKVHILNLAEENDALQKDLDSQMKQRLVESETAPAGSFPGMGNTNGVLNETITELNEQLDVVMKENVVLSEQVAILEKDMNRLTAQGRERDEQFMKVTNNFKTALAERKTLQEQIRVLRDERDSILSRLKAMNSELSDLTVERQGFVNELTEKDREIGSLQKYISRLRSELEDLVSRANAETDAQEQKGVLIAKRNRELYIELEGLQSEHENLKEAHRQLQMDFDSTKQDCEGMLGVMQGLERQIAEFVAKENSVKELSLQSKEKVEQAILEKKQAMACETQARQEIARLQGQRTIDKKENVRITQNAVNATKEAMQLQLQARSVELEEYAQRCARLTQDMERAKRDHREANSRLEALRKNSAQELKRLETCMSKLVERVEVAESRASEKETEALRAIQDCATRLVESEAEQNSLQDANRALQQRLQGMTMQAESSANELQRLSSEADKADKDAIRLRQELAALRLTSDSRIDSVTQRAKLNDQRVQQRVTEAEAKASEFQQELENVKLSMERQSKHHLEETSSTVTHFERLVAEQKEECTRLRSRAEELTGQLHLLQHERSELQSNLQHHETSTRKLEKQLHTSEKRASESKSQLAELLAAEEKRVHELTALRRKLDQAELQVNRANRERDAALQSLDDRNTTLVETRLSQAKPRASSPLKLSFSGISEKPPLSPSTRSG
eukprot:CAMPEP_0203762730 /NCGR_PEP_ID=MMETSP0098-20131031/15550_1 /ASSEMBLY_ACC=CAM_ASM_000208 /TAXON_ID=96639 /ORGANISM=" , Strain NY0313808BC1" /LENGTH=840 /DNA_ID=CAMNT_0050657251 /DNA_START=306 /DNA_END=2824 /DNA_ORIENTATION=-